MKGKLVDPSDMIHRGRRLVPKEESQDWWVGVQMHTDNDDSDSQVNFGINGSAEKSWFPQKVLFAHDRGRQK